MVGQLIDEFAIDRELLEELRQIRTLPLDMQLDPLRRVVELNPQHAPSAMMLLIAMRQAGRLVTGGGRSPNGTFERIPQRIVQYWNDKEPPAEIAELMNSWKIQHPDFGYVRFDDGTAEQFLISNGLNDVLRAFRRSRSPAQRADIFRLAYLSTSGGFYADADDRSLAPVGSFVPPDAEFVAYQEHFGTLGNNFLAVTTGHPVIRLALELGTEAVNRGDAEVLWLSTGPGLLTRAFAQVIARQNYDRAASLSAVIFDQGVIARYVGSHNPLRYKKTERHWGRFSFRRKKRQGAPQRS
jgi:mannosyltransferase OCH1-like enzyme